MVVRVSVVVPVHDPGPAFDELVASLVRQTLPSEDFEVWFCDDGSTDPEGVARLDRLTGGHDHFHVLRLPHSGWPGTPRNAGIDAATGTYVFFADDDDYLGDDALRQMVEHADAWGSDVLVPRLTRVHRRQSFQVFGRDVPDARLGVDPLLRLLTPHKLVRTALLREHGIRFPEGRVRLEDHQFVMRAFFAATRISILASYPCYYWVVRKDRRSISVGRIDPVSYYADLERVLDIVEANTEPGPLRDRLLAHWYDGKVLDRIGMRLMVGYPDDYRDELLDVLEPLVEARFPARLDAELAYGKRVRSALLRAGRRAELLELAKAESRVTCTAQTTRLRWTPEGRLEVSVAARLRQADGSPLPLSSDAAGRLRWHPPVDVPEAEAVPLRAVADDDDLAVLVRDRADETDYWPDEQARVHLDGDTLTSTTTVDPATARAGRPLARRTELGFRLAVGGWPFVNRLPVSEAVLAEAGPPRRLGRRLVTLSRGRRGQLLLTTTRVRPEPTPDPPVPTWRALRRQAKQVAHRWHTRLRRVGR